eukprot:3984585-Amphidinium_carterae.1
MPHTHIYNCVIPMQEKKRRVQRLCNQLQKSTAVMTTTVLNSLLSAKDLTSVDSQARDAFGKARTSQCILAAKTPDGEDYVVPLSWVAQASFNPPGLTMSLPKAQR